MAHINPIRPIVQRLNSVSVEELPRYAGFLAASILNCAELIQGVEGQKNDTALHIHKLTTRISSLLQDRTQEGRFTGVVLVKALLEAAGSQTLAVSGSLWVRSLLSCMNKQDPPAVKRLSIITITRIFMLTQDNQAMTREITTPTLPAFLTACLSAIKPTTVSREGIERQVPSLLVQPVLQCWVQLMRAFPSTFRPFVPTIRAIVLNLLSQQITPQYVKELASQLFATLHVCAPKDTAASEWAREVLLIIEATHQTADLIFRSVVEEWSATIPRQTVTSTGKKVSSEVHAPNTDAVGMDGWVGLQSGCSRAVDLIRLIDTMLVSQHVKAVNIPFAEVLSLTARFAAVLPSSKDYSLRENKEIGRDEREELFANLSRIHCVILELYARLAPIYGHALVPLSRPLLSQLCDIFESESFDDQIRASIYRALKELLHQSAIAVLSTHIDHVTKITRKCCGDLMLTDEKKIDGNVGRKENNNGMYNLNLHHRSKDKTVRELRQSRLVKAAWRLLPVILTCIPVALLSSSTRADIDRTAILLGHEEALLASVMNPSMSQKSARGAPSTLPFLARTGGGGLALEALMRPRRPVLRNSESLGATESTEEADDEMLQGESASAETNPHAVTDHVAYQLEDNSTLVEAHDIPSGRKRDHTAVEDAVMTSTTESSKRVRVSLLSKSAQAAMPAVEQSGYGGTGEASDVVNAEPGISETVPVVQSLSTETFQIPAVTIKPTEPPVRLPVGYDDNSDDSEIPQIDTALTSDEDEDEDLED